MSDTQPDQIDQLRQNTPFKVAAIYILVAGLWITCSDFVLGLFVTEAETLTRLQTFKGWFFVGFTGLLLFLCLRHYLRRQQTLEELTNQLHRALAGAGVGESYFTFLVKQLVTMLPIDRCLIGEWEPGSDSIDILALTGVEKADIQTTYRLDQTPCYDVVQKGTALFLPNGVSRQYPNVGLLGAPSAASYIGIPLRDSDGQVIGLLAMIGNSPLQQPALFKGLVETCAIRAGSELQRIRSERKLRDQFNQFTALFDSISAIIYVADMTSYELLYVNEFAARQFGSEWQGRTCFSYLQADRQDPCEFCTNKDLLVDGEPGPAIIWEFRNTKNNHWYQCIDKALRWPDGRLVRLEMALDITERKELEQVKDSLLSSVSHEMRTPLTAITGFAEILLDEENLPPHVMKHIRTIFKESERLGDLINTFIDVRRFKTDRARVDYANQTLQQLLQRAAESCRDCKEEHRVEIDCPPELVVYGNAKELIQVFTQLLSNACRYSPDGGRVAVRAQRDIDQVLITVVDQGIGIPADEHANIFEKFYMLDTGDTRKTGGTGLGLTLAREIVLLHSGRIWLESQPGQGSTFFVSLPLAPESSAVQPDPESPSSP